MSTNGTAISHTIAIGGTAASGTRTRLTANQHNANPNAMLPASPRKTPARGRSGLRKLKKRKPTTAPIKIEIINNGESRLSATHSAANASSDTSARPPARPSTPSVMFSALMTPSTQTNVKGMAKLPRANTPPTPNRSPRCGTNTPPQDTISNAAPHCMPSLAIGERSCMSSSAPASTSTPMPPSSDRNG